MRIWPTAAIFGAAVGTLLTAGSALAYETDPYTNRDLDLADSLAILDEKMNAALDRIAASWSRGEDEWAFITAIYRDVGGPALDRQARALGDGRAGGRQAADQPAANPCSRSCRCTPPAGSRFWGLGRTMNVNGAYIGTDKIGHFLSQGRKFYSRYNRLGSIERAAQRTAVWEALIWGRLMSGIFSNADLVANYEGFLFYRGLFQNGVVADKVALFRWEDGRPVRQRPFSWADHVNAFWDETLNPNAYADAIVPHMQRRILRLCRRLRPPAGTLPNRRQGRLERALPRDRHARRHGTGAIAVSRRELPAQPLTNHPAVPIGDTGVPIGDTRVQVPTRSHWGHTRSGSHGSHSGHTRSASLQRVGHLARRASRMAAAGAGRCRTAIRDIGQ